MQEKASLESNGIERSTSEMQAENEIRFMHVIEFAFVEREVKNRK